MKSENGKTVIVIIALILLVAFCVFGLVKCFAGITSDDGGWEKCLKCGGDGKVVNDMGYNVTCTRCNGVGQLP